MTTAVLRSVESRRMPLPFSDEELTPNQLLARYHYLGPINRGEVYRDVRGVMVFANPSSRRLPQHRWLELVRWCIVGGLGSEQWRDARQWLLQRFPDVTTVVSYSDPSAGHTGALYRACGWMWAPTWHRLREPPSGNGQWTAGKRQAVKDRWIAVLRPDDERERLLRVEDESLRKRMVWAEYREPRWKRGHAIMESGGGNFQKFVSTLLRDAAQGKPKESKADETVTLDCGCQRTKGWRCPYHSHP